MKAYKFEVVVINHENMTLDDIEYELTRSRHIGPHIISVEEADIGEWDDDHPLNKLGCDYSQYFPVQ